MATGCYKPDYLTGSFRGVSLGWVKEASSDHGRRGAEGEFPFGEDTAYADLGRKIRKFSISGEFRENSHIADAQALIYAVEATGPATLVHPTRGVLQAACTSLKVKDNLEEQGYTEYTMDLVEANDWINGFSFGLTIAGIDIIGLVAELTSWFPLFYIPGQVAYFSKLFAMTNASAALSDIAEEIARAVASSSTDHDNAWWVRSDLLEIAGDPTKMSLAQRVIDGMSLGMVALRSYLDRDDGFAAFKRLANNAAKRKITLSEEGGTTQAAGIASIRILAAAYMAQAVLDSPPSTLAEALRKLDAVTSIFDEEIEAARAMCSNAIFLKLRETKLAAEKSIQAIAYGLPALVVYNYSRQVHSLLPAYEVWNDSTRFREVEVKNPNKLPWSIGPNVVMGVK